MSQSADESDLKEDYPSQLRDSLRCQILLKLVLQLPRLTVIPHTVFEHMPLLEVLDLSSTSIQSLPSSVSSLSSLKELLLRECSFLIELPIEIGMLTKLKLLDIEGSKIMYIPKEIVELTDLEVLRLCFSQYAEYYIKAKNINGGVIVPRMMISKLKKLKELCISVCQEAEWWEKEIKEIQDEICHLENLEFLKWYLPTDTTLKQFLDIQINRKPAYEKLSNFTFTIGQHAQLTSCLSRGLEKKFAEFEKCLKWINAEGNIYDISKIMTRAKALFLSRHWTIVNLSAFDISKLKYFLLAECNEMETLVKIDDLSEIVENNKSGLESLEYLSIHYMEKLKSIWEGPIGKDSLSRLRILAFHTCLELTTIFTPRIAQNLSCLAELTVEECPKVRSLISTPHSEHGPLFSSLERIFLIDLPELDHIFGGLIVLEKLESLMIYNCVKLRRLSEMELPRIQKIKGEIKWWNSLNAYEPTWENVFEPLKEKSKLIEQLLEATNSLQHFHDVVSREAKEEKPLDGPGLGAQETKIGPFNFPLRKEEGRFHTLPGKRNISGSEMEQDAFPENLGAHGSSMKDVDVACEIDLLYDEYIVSTDTSQESGDANREPGRQRNSGGNESFLKGKIKKSLREFSKSTQHADQRKVNVTVNGHPIVDQLVKKAEKLAGPIEPGDYWYDIRAGFWGIMGGPCRGIIPPFIVEFNYHMPKKCAGGNTNVFVNGRELHQRDLDLLASRGLPTDTDRSYVIEISGRVLDEDSGQELQGLGKLAPTVERKKHGFGMKPPRTIDV